MEKNWVRRLIWNEFWSNNKAIKEKKCRNKTIGVIKSQKDWEAKWEFYRGPTKYNQLPAIDFKAEVVLIVYLPKSPPILGYDSIIVDKKDDLTVHPLPPPKGYYPNGCSVLLVEIYRSGVKSIEGKPLPPPSSQE